MMIIVFSSLLIFCTGGSVWSMLKPAWVRPGCSAYWTIYLISLYLSFFICKLGNNQSVYLIEFNVLILVQYLENA